MLMSSIEQEKLKEAKGEKNNKLEAPAQVTSNALAAMEEDITVRSGATNGNSKPPDPEIEPVASQGTSMSIEANEAISANEAAPSGPNGMEVGD
jgi:hypothetical protein